MRLPLLRQLNGDLLGLARSAQSGRYGGLKPRVADADRVVGSICPYCAVGCGQKIYVGRRRLGTAVGGAALPAGSLCTRFAVYYAGFQSARDPRATVGPQRDRLRRAS